MPSKKYYIIQTHNKYVNIAFIKKYWKLKNVCLSEKKLLKGASLKMGICELIGITFNLNSTSLEIEALPLKDFISLYLKHKRL